MEDIKYENNKFKFAYRVSAIIYNVDKTKILLFTGNDSEFYMLPGGKVKELERSTDAIKREIKEEVVFKRNSYKIVVRDFTKKENHGRICVFEKE